jgi:hypothetical protein
MQTSLSNYWYATPQKQDDPSHQIVNTGEPPQQEQSEERGLMQNIINTTSQLAYSIATITQAPEA